MANVVIQNETGSGTTDGSVSHNHWQPAKVTADSRSRLTGTRLQEGFVPSASMVWLMIVTCLIALGTSGYLSWNSLTSSSIAGCGGDLFDCSHVTSSRWSLWLGIPVSLLAVGHYVSLTSALGLARFGNISSGNRQKAWFAVMTLAIAGGFAAIWFISLQIFSLGHLCHYCLAAHGCGLILALLLLKYQPNGWASTKASAGLAVLGFAALAGGQLATTGPAKYKIETYPTPILNNDSNSSEPLSEDAPVFEAPVFEAPIFEAPVEATETTTNESDLSQIDWPAIQSLGHFWNAQTLTTSYLTYDGDQEGSGNRASKSQDDQPKKERRFVMLGAGSLKLDVAQWPITGSKEAKYIFIEMFDYSCGHCRATHKAIKSATEKLNNDMAVITLPIPLNTACNPSVSTTQADFTESCELAKLAVAVWRVNPVKFNEFHNSMMTAQPRPSYATAKSQADALVGKEKIDKELESQIPAKYIQQTTELYRKMGAGILPKLIFPKTSVIGEYTSSDGLAELVKEQ
ncbi:MAG: vitamin K epoxide reductase family protein, partial [Planctomycetota bacterium]